MLQDLRWYKGTFLTKILIGDDCQHSYWKERFLIGLLRLFMEKFRNRIRNDFNGSIPYDIFHMQNFFHILIIHD